MLVLFTLLLVVTLCLSIKNYYSFYNNDLHFFVGMIATVFLMATLIVWPLNYYSIKGDIPKYYAFNQTVQQARENKDLTGYERVAITNKIAENNEWLASVQYWNQTFLQEAIPDEVMNMEYIK